VSKAYKGKTCIYCTVDGVSTSQDHVVAREFFPPHQRHDIPKVPACDACNNQKSKLEHYLTTVLPFGGRHEKSPEILSELVPRRLQRNRKLQRELLNSWKSEISISHDGHLQPQHTFNVDADKIEELYDFMVRGLCWSEWQLLLPKSKSEIQVGFLTSEGEELTESLLRMNAKRRCRRDIADGLFRYEGVQAVDNDLITIWKMSLYGVEFSEGEQSKGRAFLCYASSAPIGNALPIGSG
jgi:hypothetical protein